MDWFRKLLKLRYAIQRHKTIKLIIITNGTDGNIFVHA